MFRATVILAGTALMAACCVIDDETTYYSEEVATVGETVISPTRTAITIPLTEQDDTLTSADERLLDDLWLYAYSLLGDSLSRAVHLTDLQNVTTPYYVEEDGDTIATLDYTITDGDTLLTVSTPLDAGMFCLYLIANAGGLTGNNGSSLLTGEETQDSLEAITVSKEQLLSTADEEAKGLIMATKLRDQYVSEGTTSEVEAALTFACAKLDYTITFDIYDESHLSFDDDSIKSLYDYYGKTTLTVDSVCLERVSARSALAVAGEEDAFLGDTLRINLGTDGVAKNGEDSVVITGTCYLPERYVSDVDNQTRLRIYGRMTMDGGAPTYNVSYSLVIGGDATDGKTVNAEDRTNLGTLRRGNRYQMQAWLGYDNTAYLRLDIVAKAFIEVEEETMTTDD